MNEFLTSRIFSSQDVKEILEDFEFAGGKVANAAVRAAKLGHVNTLKYVHVNGVDFCAWDKLDGKIPGWKPFYEAALAGQERVIDFLYSTGFDASSAFIEPRGSKNLISILKASGNESLARKIGDMATGGFSPRDYFVNAAREDAFSPEEVGKIISDFKGIEGMLGGVAVRAASKGNVCTLKYLYDIGVDFSAGQIHVEGKSKDKVPCERVLVVGMCNGNLGVEQFFAEKYGEGYINAVLSKQNDDIFRLNGRADIVAKIHKLNGGAETRAFAASRDGVRGRRMGAITLAPENG